jgi:DNA-binding response OmpR family regulator
VLPGYLDPWTTLASLYRKQVNAVRILIIEDESKVALALQEGLARQRYSVKIASTGEEGFFLLNSEKFDLLILDLMLPGRDGLDILRTLREKRIGLPVLILTARDSLEDRVEGLESGADDYLVKPFAFPELLARVHALLRRGQQDTGTSLVLADLDMNLMTRQVRRAGKAILLTSKETDLLEYLLRHRNTVVTREMLGRDVWHAAARATPLDNVIDVHITHLRHKIDELHELKLLHTIRGVGFILSREKP